MAKISKQALQDSLHKYFMTLEPLARNVTVNAEVKQVPQADGTTKQQITQQKGDVYFDKSTAKSMAMSIARAIFEHVIAYVESPVVAKLNELIDEYNQLRADIVTAAIPTTAQSVDKINQ